MKQSVMMSAALVCALALTGCSNDEVLERNQSRAIGFAAMTNNSTRSTDPQGNDLTDFNEITTANLSFFRVYGYFRDHGTSNVPTQILSSEAVNKVNNVWTYENTRYWAPSNDYYFMAFTTNTQGERPWHYTFPETNVEDALAAFQANHGCGTLTLDYSDNATEACRYDLVYSYAYRETDAAITDVTAVPFTFDHLLARVRFKFTNSMDDANSTISIENLKISGTPVAGSITFAASNSYTGVKWTANTAKGNVDVAFGTGNLTDFAISRTRNSQCRYLIPVTQALTVTFDVTWKINGTVYGKYTKTANIASQEYLKGTSYQFNAEINEESLLGNDSKPITFTVTTVNGWPSWGDGSDLTLQ